MTASDDPGALLARLFSDASSFMTGAVYPVDGGALATSHVL
jgi:hypothetical protein